MTLLPSRFVYEDEFLTHSSSFDGVAALDKIDEYASQLISFADESSLSHSTDDLVSLLSS